MLKDDTARISEGFPVKMSELNSHLVKPDHDIFQCYTPRVSHANRRKIPKQIFFDDIVLRQFEEKMREKGMSSLSETIRMYSELGLFIDNIKHEVKNPEFLRQLEEIMNENKIFEWTSSMTDDQLNAIKMAVELEREQRYKR